MDWVKAYEGLMFIDSDPDNHPAVNGILHTIFDLMRAQMWRDETGGQLCHEEISTLLNEWAIDDCPDDYGEFLS